MGCDWALKWPLRTGEKVSLEEARVVFKSDFFEVEIGFFVLCKAEILPLPVVGCEVIEAYIKSVN